MIRTIDPARDVDGRRTEHTALGRGALMNGPGSSIADEVAVIVAIRQVHVGRHARVLISTWPSALSRVKALSRGRFASRSRRKLPIASVPERQRQFVRRGDTKFGDARLDVLEDAIDQLDIALGLLAEHDAKISARDQVLLDGLPMQIPDRHAATEQDHDDEGDADRPQVQARTGAAPPGHRDVGPRLHLLALHARAQWGDLRSMLRPWLISD